MTARKRFPHFPCPRDQLRRPVRRPYRIGYRRRRSGPEHRPLAADRQRERPQRRSARRPDRRFENHPNAVTESAIADNAVGTTEVADGAIGEADLGANSVGSSELQTGSIRASELGPMTQVTNSVTVAPNGNTYVVANCPAGTTVVSGGGEPSSYQVYLVGSVRSGNGWMAVAHSTAGANTTLTAYAYCLVGGSSN